MMSCSERMIIEFENGEGFECVFDEPRPDWILIKSTTDANGRVTPRLTDHDRFDFNKRAVDAWEKRCWEFATNKAHEIGKKCRIYGVNPFIPMGGYTPSQNQ